MDSSENSVLTMPRKEEKSSENLAPCSSTLKEISLVDNFSDLSQDRRCFLLSS